MLNRWCIHFTLLALPLAARAQDDGPVQMTPDFALAFPITTDKKEVSVKYPVMVSPTTVLKPGMILRVLYILNLPNDGGPTDLALAHKGNMEQSFSRSTMSSDEQSKMPPELAHQIEGYRRTVWEVPTNFILAMAQYPTDAMHLIYSPSGKDNELSDAMFSFFEGMLIGLPDGKVTVLAVETHSKADVAGIKAGDVIVAVGGTPVPADLSAFATAYAAAKKNAKEGNATSFPLSVRTAGADKARDVPIAMPPTIKSQLMNGF